MSGHFPINLDVATEAELRTLSDVYSKLAAIAEHKAQAIKLRGMKDEDAAASFDRAAEHHERKLPEWAQWK